MNCRFCKTDEEPLFKYAVRHYVCVACGMKQWGADFFDKIPQHELGQMPYFVVKEAGLLPELERRLPKSQRA